MLALCERITVEIAHSECAILHSLLSGDCIATSHHLHKGVALVLVHDTGLDLAVAVECGS